MTSINSFKQLEKLMRQRVIDASKSNEVANVFKDAMQESVETEVYDYYDPRVYKRREEDGGLSDPENMKFTSDSFDGNTISLDFENLTVGSSASVYGHETDSMNGYYISHLIENGSDNVHTSPRNSEDGWYKLGEWSDPRPFAKATAEKLNSTGSKYNSRLKETLEEEINR